MKNLNIKNRKHEKNTTRLPVPAKVKRGFSFYCSTILALTLVMGLAMPASATGGDPLTVVNNLSDFIFGLIRAVGMILLGWGIVQVGLSLQSHDPLRQGDSDHDHRLNKKQWWQGETALPPFYRERRTMNV